MSASGQYRDLWELVKSKRVIPVKLTGITREGLMRMIAKEKNEDQDIQVRLLRLKSIELFDSQGIPTGMIRIELNETKQKTRTNTIGKLLKNMDF